MNRCPEQGGGPAGTSHPGLINVSAQAPKAGLSSLRDSSLSPPHSAVLWDKACLLRCSCCLEQQRSQRESNRGHRRERKGRPLRFDKA